MLSDSGNKKFNQRVLHPQCVDCAVEEALEDSTREKERAAFGGNATLYDRFKKAREKNK